MKKSEMVSLLVEDLKNEVTHLNFYLWAASNVLGPFREPMKKFFSEAAESELKHVMQFADLIVSLGGIPEFVGHEFPKFQNHLALLSHAATLESQVTRNYAERIDHAELLEDKVESKYLVVFLEDQLEHSKQDLNELILMTKV